MGMAVGARRIAVGAKGQIGSLQNNGELAATLAAILRRDPAGELVLIEGRTANWTRLLRERFGRTVPDVVDRVRFLPMLPNQDYLQLLSLAEVLLEPPHFGGGNTSYEGLARGTPIVTWPSELLRGQITYALYRKMGYTDLVVDSADAYVDLAVRLACDTTAVAAAREQIASTAGQLFEDPREVADLEVFLQSAAETELPAKHAK
jgi:predicted O-linked N-acetylglucosamine transferase (SPINDLY family)